MTDNHHRVNPPGEPESDDDFLVLLNGGDAAFEQTLPSSGFGDGWEALLDTSQTEKTLPRRYKAGEPCAVLPRSFVLLVRRVAARPADAGEG